MYYACDTHSYKTDELLESEMDLKLKSRSLICFHAFRLVLQFFLVNRCTRVITLYWHQRFNFNSAHSSISFICYQVSFYLTMSHKKKPVLPLKRIYVLTHFSVCLSLHSFYVNIVYSRVRSCRNNLQSVAHAGSLLSLQDPSASFLFARKNQQATCLIIDRLRIRVLGVSDKTRLSRFSEWWTLATFRYIQYFSYKCLKSCNTRRTRSAFVIPSSSESFPRSGKRHEKYLPEKYMRMRVAS